MRALGLVALFSLAVVAAVVLFSVFPRSSPTADTASAGLPSVTPSPIPPEPTPEPPSWVTGLTTSRHGIATQVSCLDVNGDGVIDAGDSDEFAGLDIPIDDGAGCNDPAHHADYYVGDPSDAGGYHCDAPVVPVLIVAIASAGSDLLDTTEGESLGVLDIVNALQARLAALGAASVPILSASAVFGADEPQTRNEEWIERELSRRLDDMPCLRTVMIGHSHGGVTVTSVTAALDDDYFGRIYGVLIDRTNVLYDRSATEIPSRIPLLNVFQTNEGWHGNVYGSDNNTNVDESTERAPIAPSDGGGDGLALVSHKTLDDALPVQQRIVDAVMTWLFAPAP